MLKRAYLWTTRMDAFKLDATRRGDQQSEFARQRNIGGAARGAQDVSLPPRPRPPQGVSLCLLQIYKMF